MRSNRPFVVIDVAERIHFYGLPTIHLHGIEIVASPITLLKIGSRLCKTQPVAVGRIGIHQKGNAHLQTLT